MLSMFQVCRAQQRTVSEDDVSGGLCHHGVLRKRSLSDEEGTFILEQNEALGLRDVLHASLCADMVRRLHSSLQETIQDVRAMYPEEGDDFTRIRLRTQSDLSEFLDTKALPDVQNSSTQPQACQGTGASKDTAGVPEKALGQQLLQHDGLVDHEQLVEAIYKSQGLDLSSIQTQARDFLAAIGMRPLDVGVQNTDEEGRVMMNQCFYLSLARGYLGHNVATSAVHELALKLKRVIEACVIEARPAWAAGAGLGVPGQEEAMAFADFLPLAMNAGSTPASGEAKSNASGVDSPQDNLIASMVICILDSVTGHVEVYIGPRYKDLQETEARLKNLVLLWYTPGHYQCLVVGDEQGSKVSMSYDEFKQLLTKHGVIYVETNE
eukprot:TRINITY_DN75249_c0_g1_i1.p1 TRINITY_DN75249_c0_g1~~TRINITY_DN75249_c0_g1_i1.p1  ORF type:complete len:380 (+),score=55.52 TRINITY_DN75249_c0_g1_i1:96-1235(+)